MYDVQAPAEDDEISAVYSVTFITNPCAQYRLRTAHVLFVSSRQLLDVM